VSTTVATSAPATGAHKLYLVFTGPTSQDFVNIHWFQFATTPTGGGPISPSAWYELVNQSGGGCIDAAGWATANGTAVQQWACGSGQQNQQWRFLATDGGNYRVVSRNAADQVLDVTGGPSATADGVPIQTWAWASGTNQQWQPLALTSGAYALKARHSGKCLEVPDGTSANGTRLRQATCNGSAAQTFRLNERP
jgi:glucosylceramidase